MNILNKRIRYLFNFYIINDFTFYKNKYFLLKNKGQFLNTKNNNVIKMNNYSKKEFSENLNKKTIKKGLGKTLWVRKKRRK